MEILYKLNHREIENAKPRERDYRMSDGGGLYLVVKTTGKKLQRWSFEFDGKEKLLFYGPYPFVTTCSAPAPSTPYA